jgi:multidrug efflux pump subunit AcrB
MGFNLSAWAIRQRSLVIYFMLIVVAAGLLSYFRLGRSEDPSFIIKTMVVQAAWPGASMEDTLQQVTERLERTLQETSHLDNLRSYTRPASPPSSSPSTARAPRRRWRIPGTR